MLAILQTTPVNLSEIARQTAQLLMPEVVLLIFACGALILDVLLPRGQKRAVAYLSIAGLLTSFGSLVLQYLDKLSRGSSHPCGIEPACRIGQTIVPVLFQLCQTSSFAL